MELKPNLLDYILFRWDKYDKVKEVRNEIKLLLDMFNKLSDGTKLKYQDIWFTTPRFYNIDEVAWLKSNDLETVLEVVTKYRNELRDKLSQVAELDLDTTKSRRRLERLEELGI